jgi:RNA polymerase sigma-B factor
MIQEDMYPAGPRPIRKMQNLIFQLSRVRRSIVCMAPNVARSTERSRLIEEYLPLARGAARRFARRGVERDDLTQVASLAIVRAVDRCDPRRTELLPAYVSRSVEGELRRHLRDRAAAVRVPRAARSDDTPERRTAEAPISLGDEDWGTDTEPLEDVMLERALIARAARALDVRQRRILLLRFFLDRTQEEVADELGISQAHVSRLLDDALRRMRRRLERDEPLMPERQRARVEAYGLESGTARGG